jgi:hypothetical protein
VRFGGKSGPATGVWWGLVGRRPLSGKARNEKAGESRAAYVGRRRKVERGGRWLRPTVGRVNFGGSATEQRT